MNMFIIIGTVKSEPRIDGEGKFACLVCYVQIFKRSGDRTYKKTIRVESFGNSIHVFKDQIKAGMLVECTGEADAQMTTPRDGDPYAQLRLIGTIRPFVTSTTSGPVTEVEINAGSLTPKTTQAER